MRIRVATTDDAEQLARVHVASWQSAYRGILTDSYLDALTAADREPLWHHRLTTAHPDGCTLVAEAEVEGGIVGFAAAGPERDGLPGYDGEIYAVYLLSNHRRHGIGRQLMVASAQHLAAKGFRAALLWVLEENQPARAFYEALGGQLIGRKTAIIGNTQVIEVAYGWPSLNMLRGASCPNSQPT